MIKLLIGGSPCTYDYRGNGGQNKRISELSCVSLTDLIQYQGEAYCLYGWHISDLVIYDEPKELSEFRTMCKYRNDDGSCQYQKVECNCVEFYFNPDYSLNLAQCLDYMSRPPQSWCYVEKLK